MAILTGKLVAAYSTSINIRGLLEDGVTAIFSSIIDWFEVDGYSDT